MSSARTFSSRLSPGLLAGLAGGAGALLVWDRTSRRSRTSSETQSSYDSSPDTKPVHDRRDDTRKKTAKPKRTGPMVAVYLNNESVEKLHNEHPEASRGRFRKVVIQYNPTDKERAAYDAHFGGVATVKLIGEAFGDHRRALVASVSKDGTPVEPLGETFPAVDITPGEVGGGPLGSVALVHQIKHTEAMQQTAWRGKLPGLTVHDREFLTEEGGYDKLEEPLILTGTICRADWVEGKTGRCQTHTQEGLKRTDGWTPQGCIVCNTLEASPCRDIFKRFERNAERLEELESTGKQAEGTPAQGSSAEDSSGEDPEKSEVHAHNGTNGSNGDGGSGMGVDATSTKSATGNKEVPAAANGEMIAASVPEGGEWDETAEDSLRKQEVERLEDERGKIAMELLQCADYYNVWGDSSADDGVLGDGDDGDDAGNKNMAGIGDEAGDQNDGTNEKTPSKQG